MRKLTLDFFLYMWYGLHTFGNIHVIRKTLSTLLWRDRLAASMVILSFLLNIALWIWLWRAIPEPEAFRVLRYSTYFGITDFGPAKNLFQIPLAGSVFWLANTLLAFFFLYYKKNDAHVILGMSVIVQILLMIPALVIIMLPPV